MTKGAKGGATGQTGGANPYQLSSGLMNTGAGAINTAGQMYGSGGVDHSQATNALAQAMGLFSNPNIGRVGTHTVSANGLPTRAASYGAINVGSHGYNAANAIGRGYNAANATGRGYNAAGVGSQGYTADLQNKSPLIKEHMGKYYNPYTNAVISNTQRDIDRARRMQINDAGAAASAAGAFGGSRHGLVEAETNRAAQETLADTSADLRNRMFDTAAQLGGMDVSNILGVRALNQGAQNRAREFGASASNTARLATQAAQNRAREFGAQAGNVASLSNQAAQNRAREFGAQAGNVASLSNQAAHNAARAFGAQASNVASLSNQAAKNTARQFGATNRQNTGQFNANLLNNLRMFNAGQRTTADQTNAAAGMARAGGLMDVASGFQNQQQMQSADELARAAGMLGVGGAASDLGQQAYGVGSDIGNRQMQQGTMAQALRQMLLDSGRGMFDQYTGQPQNLLNLRLASVGANPLSNAGTTTTTTRQPMDWLGLIGNLARAGGTAASGGIFG